MKQILFLAMLLTTISVWGQQDDSTDSTAKSVFSGSINYQSRLHYFGRVDSLKSSGLFPIIGYQFKNGLYAQGTAVFVRNAAQPLNYTGGSIELGYRLETTNFDLQLFGSKFFYKEQGPLVQSALQGQTGLNLSFKTNVVNLNAGADLKFSQQTDVGLTAGIDRLFVMPIKGVEGAALAVMPSATLNAGTQRFITQSASNGNFMGLPLTREKTEAVSRLNILSYEFSIPVVFVWQKLNAYVSPSYVVPQNLVAAEQGAPLFYVTTGLGFRL